jgi:hypothetical protein
MWDLGDVLDAGVGSRRAVLKVEEERKTSSSGRGIVTADRIFGMTFSCGLRSVRGATVIAHIN